MVRSSAITSRYLHQICRQASIALVAVAWLAGSTPARAAETQELSFAWGDVEFLGDGPSSIELGTGIFNFNDPKEGFAGAASALYRGEFRFGEKLWFFGPLIGILGNSDEGLFGYGGIYADIRYDRLVITPEFAVGGYGRGDGPDLGGVLQFRSAITFAYLFDGGMRLGVGLSHISSAGTHYPNPGTEELFVSLVFPMPF